MSRHSRNLALNARVQIPQIGGETSFPHLQKVMLGGGGGVIRCDQKVQERVACLDCKLRLMSEGRWKRLVGSSPP